MKRKFPSTRLGFQRGKPDQEASLIAHDPRLTALIERGMSEPGWIPFGQVEQEVSRRARSRKSR